MTIKTLPKDKKIILFDGVCNLCNTSVQFVIKRDKNDIFRFVSLQSELGQSILKEIGLPTQQFDSIVLYEADKLFYSKASAAIRILIYLGGIYKTASIFKLFPKLITNAIYDYIARNRYHWFGKRESCMLPSQGVNSKFLA